MLVRADLIWSILPSSVIPCGDPGKLRPHGNGSPVTRTGKEHLRKILTTGVGYMRSRCERERVTTLLFYAIIKKNQFSVIV